MRVASGDIILSSVFMYHFCSNHSSVCGHLDCFHVLPLLNRAADEHAWRLEFCLDICPGVGCLDPVAVLFLAPRGTSMLLSTVAAPALIPSSAGGSLSPLPYPPRHFLFLDFDDGHSYRCEVIPHCGFDLHFSNN